MMVLVVVVVVTALGKIWCDRGLSSMLKRFGFSLLQG